MFAALEERLGAVFVYGDPLPVCPDSPEAAASEALTAEALAGVPRALIDQMRSATLNADLDQLESLIDQVAAHSAPLAGKLRKLADDFQYDTLLGLFQD